MPSSRSVGRTSASTAREISEYSICRSLTGCTACARRIVAASTSESPTCRTYPASIISLTAPTVSSTGTSGSSRAGR